MRYSMKTRKTFIDTISVLFILMFLHTGVNKLLHLEKTYLQMKNQPFPDSYAGFMTWAVPIFELVLVVLLLVPLIIPNKVKLLGLYIATITMAAFTVYVSIIWFGRGNWSLPCSCGGFLASMSWLQHFYFNLCFTVLGCIAIILQKGWITSKASGYRNISLANEK